MWKIYLNLSEQTDDSYNARHSKSKWFSFMRYVVGKNPPNNKKVCSLSTNEMYIYAFSNNQYAKEFNEAIDNIIKYRCIRMSPYIFAAHRFHKHTQVRMQMRLNRLFNGWNHPVVLNDVFSKSHISYAAKWVLDDYPDDSLGNYLQLFFIRYIYQTHGNLGIYVSFLAAFGENLESIISTKIQRG